MRVFAAIFVVLLVAVAGRASAATTPLVMTEYMVPSADPGINLYVRNKHPRGMTNFRPENVVLFVHGSTYPAETAFDLPLGGMSWMDYIAQHGYDVWLVDLRGYGKSDRPPEMAQPPGANPPLVRTPTAVKDVGSAVDYIKSKRGVAKLDLMGWSWGTTIMGAYTADHNANVNKLVLYAPQWLRAAGNVALTTPVGPVGAYRSVSMASAKDRWLKGVAPEKAADLIPAGWFDQWASATLASDPVGSKANPPVLRAPNGTVADTADYWSAGKPLYDPARITVPTLLVHAEWDQDLPTYMVEAYYKVLTNVPYKRYVQIGEGTHTIMMEKNRMQLFSEVQLFLDEHRVAE
ncbi:MAG: alpha/beta fold hydrolase [Candidatus Velthaea sp.]